MTIERIEYEIVERAFSEGWVTPQIAPVRTGRSVAVVGSGRRAWPWRSSWPAPATT